LSWGLTYSLSCAAEQREFESSLKKRKRDFGETLERYEAEVDKYAQRSELSKRDEVAAQVTDLSQKLKEVCLCLTRNFKRRSHNRFLRQTFQKDIDDWQSIGPQHLFRV